MIDVKHKYCFLDEEGLSSLTRKINEVEDELEKAGLDATIQTLRSARNKQALWIKNYEDELEILRKEVENVQVRSEYTYIYSISLN